MNEQIDKPDASVVSPLRVPRHARDVLWYVGAMERDVQILETIPLMLEEEFALGRMAI